MQNPVEPTPAPAPLPLVAQGKVRDIYALDQWQLVMVASDRISAYDWVLPTPIPDKGRILTQLSAWWFEQLADLVPHHLVSADPTGIPQAWQGRAMVVRKLDMIGVECVARGYLTGSALAQVRATGELDGLALPHGSSDGLRLQQPVFTPATKAEVGMHDENINLAQAQAMLGRDLATRLQQLTVAIYQRAHQICAQRGIILADFKLEFGTDPATGALTLADEVLTPDSSRFWLMPEDGLWEVGSAPTQAPVSFDKQYVRDWLTSPDSGWERDSDQPPPALPDQVVEGTRSRYIQAYERLTGRTFA